MIIKKDFRRIYRIIAINLILKRCAISYFFADVDVIGVPDEKWGEQVKAIVVLKPGYQVSEEEIINFCRQSLAGFKTPKSVDYIDIIPRNAAGKMLKKDLRKPYWEGRDTFIS